MPDMQKDAENRQLIQELTPFLGASINIIQVGARLGAIEAVVCEYIDSLAVGPRETTEDDINTRYIEALNAELLSAKEQIESMQRKQALLQGVSVEAAAKTGVL
jgi:methionine aminopeptidase